MLYDVVQVIPNDDYSVYVYFTVDDPLAHSA